MKFEILTHLKSLCITFKILVNDASEKELRLNKVKQCFSKVESIETQYELLFIIK